VAEVRERQHAEVHVARPVPAAAPDPEDVGAFEQTDLTGHIGRHAATLHGHVDELLAGERAEVLEVLQVVDAPGDDAAVHEVLARDTRVPGGEEHIGRAAVADAVQGHLEGRLTDSVADPGRVLAEGQLQRARAIAVVRPGHHVEICPAVRLVDTPRVAEEEPGALAVLERHPEVGAVEHPL
jgi:hypothetical protein